EGEGGEDHRRPGHAAPRRRGGGHPGGREDSAVGGPGGARFRDGLEPGAWSTDRPRGPRRRSVRARRPDPRRDLRRRLRQGAVRCGHLGLGRDGGGGARDRNDPRRGEILGRWGRRPVSTSAAAAGSPTGSTRRSWWIWPPAPI